MIRQTLPLVLLLAASSSANASNQLQKVISDLLMGNNTQDSTDPSLARCESTSGQERTCNLPAATRAEYVRQISRTTCIKGKNLFIHTGTVVVSKGCRAEFRLIDSGVVGPATPGSTGSLGDTIAQGLRAKLAKPEKEYGSLYDVRVLTTKSISPAGSAEQAYTGTANSTWGGRVYPLDYSARVNAASGQLMNLDYQYQNPNATGTGQWQDGTALDSEAQVALMKAIRADYMKRNSGSHVQVVVNNTYKEQGLSRSDYRFSGHYGVSINDGNWQTYRYTARIFLPRNTVSELETNVQAQ